MKVLILGAGVIGTTYAYILKESGHEVLHLVRDKVKDQFPRKINVNILDGRKSRKGKEYSDLYEINLAKPNSTYDFIIVSVPEGKLKEAIDSIKAKNIQGTLVLFCNFWNTRSEIEQMVGDFPYIIGFPTAGGRLENDRLDCVLFDHIKLERKGKTSIMNYEDLSALFTDANLKIEKPFDLVEWIWIHMAVNAGVTSTAGREGDLSDPTRLVLELMDSSRLLSDAVLTIRQTLTIVQRRGVDLKRYQSDVLPYKIPHQLAGVLMKRLFNSNRLTRRIMTLHSDISDILYGCVQVYQTGKALDVNASTFYKNVEKVEHFLS